MISVKDASIKVTSKGAREVTIDSVMTSGVVAAAENARQFDLIKHPRKVFEGILVGLNGVLSVGETITLKHNRFGLEAGHNFIIIGIEERYLKKQTAIKIWG
jgi:hypothetical protein